jgi:tryptophan synthase alpha chain
LPIEEATTLLETASDIGIAVTLLVAPTSSPERIKAIATQSNGFIYLVSVTGVTGMRSALQGRVEELLREMRRVTDKPIGVGFGISNGQQAQQVREWGADAVIVGSAFVQRLATDTPTEGLQAVGQLCRELKSVLDSPRHQLITSSPEREQN